MIRISALFLIIIACISITSCATLVNQPYTTVTIHTTAPSQIVIGNDTLAAANNKVSTPLLRDRDDVQFTTITDGRSIGDYKIISRNSLAFYGNLYGYVGFVVDWNNPKRYTYPRHVFVNSNDTVPKIYAFDQSDRKGKFFVNLGIPYVNMFQLKPVGHDYKVNTGFWGISAGADYYYKSDKFVNLTFGAAADFLLPVLAPAHVEGEYEQMTSAYINASDNFKFGRFAVGYGVSFARNGWSYTPDESLRRQYRLAEVRTSNYAGLVTSAQMQTGRFMTVGLLYRPYFVRFAADNIFDYQHVISLEFIWKIPI